MRYDGRMKFHSWYSSPAVVSICKYSRGKGLWSLASAVVGGIGTWPEEGARAKLQNLFFLFGTNSLRVCLKELGCLP